MKKQVDPKISAYFSELAKKRKNPHKFNTETAKLAVEAKKKKNELEHDKT